MGFPNGFPMQEVNPVLVLTEVDGNGLGGLVKLLLHYRPTCYIQNSMPQ